MHPYGSIRDLNTSLVYLTIQSAINAPETLSGHTIFVEAGTYYENVVVNKTLSLVGENSGNTIVDGTGKDVFNIVSTEDCVDIIGFTIQNGLNGIILSSSSDNHNIIGNKIINNNQNGIHIPSWSSHNNIHDNVISGNGGGIYWWWNIHRRKVCLHFAQQHYFSKHCDQQWLWYYTC
jgi:nitrous oxidase accessory protein NosD